MKLFVIVFITAIAVSAAQPTATFNFKYAEGPNGYHTITLCIPEINYCSKPALYKQIGKIFVDEQGNTVDIEKKTMDMAIEACMHTDAYVDLNGRTIDCGKMHASELTPAIGVFIKLYEGFVSDHKGKAGNFKDIGFTELEKSFFAISEIKNGAVFTLKSNIHDCKKGSKWIIIGKPSPENVSWTLTEPDNATCKTFISDMMKASYNWR